MKITLTRDDIKTHAAALERIEKLEAWGKGSHCSYRSLNLRHSSSDKGGPYVKCGHATQRGDEGYHEEAIFRKHMDAAIDEALAYWRKQAGLEEPGE